MFDAQQLRQLQALGLSPMRLRGRGVMETAPVAMPETRLPAGSNAAAPITMPVHLWFPPDDADAFTGPHSRLLTQILQCLGLTPDHVQPGLPAEGEAALLLAFGLGAPQGAIRMSALAKLRDPIEKRVAWPILRGVRRRLRLAVG